MTENYEELNRRAWEIDSTVSSIPPSAPPPNVTRDAQGHIVISRFVQPSTTPTQQHVRRNQQPQSSAQGRFSNSHYQPRDAPVGFTAQQRLPGNALAFLGATTTDRRTIAQGNPHNQAQRNKPLTRTQWAEAPSLITTQQQLELDNERHRKKLREVYLRPLEENADPYGVGYYLWNSKGTSPKDLLGWNLEALDKIRLKYRVHIDWQENTQSLRIASRSEMNHELYIIKVIKAIREAIEDLKAKSISATPIYIALPPTAVRSIVRPSIVQPKRVTAIELAGEPLSEEEMLLWKQERLKMFKSINKQFEELIVKSLLKLAPDKGWMRLRIHFGHVAFTIVHNSFKEGKQGFKEFSRMMTNSRTTGYLERQFKNAAIALNMKKRIVDWPTRFMPISGLSKLENVKFKDTEILFVSILETGACLRVEAEIDKSSEENEYQIGSINFFHSNRRNKRMEITMLDVEKQVDWQMEVISDNALPEKEWAPKLLEIIKSSITNKTPTNIDSLGLPFPGVTPNKIPSNIEVTSMVVRSVISYKMCDSGYIVEIGIYREWQGSSTKSGNPSMKCGVSMYHPAWDYETENIEKSDRERVWDRKLSQFFDNGFTQESCGLGALRGDIEVVQELLSAAQKAVGI